MFEFVLGIARAKALDGLGRRSSFDAEGYDGCARRVTINKKSPGVPLLVLQDLTNPAAR